MLRDFPITGNEGATKAEEYYSLPEAGMFVKKGHGLKELDAVAPSKGSKWSVTILHIDSSREDVDYIQFDRVPDYHTEGYFSSTIALISRGETSQLDGKIEIAFRAMRGEKITRPLPPPESRTVEAFIRTESLQVEKNSWSYLERDRFQVYKGHSLLPGDTVYNEAGTSSPVSFVIRDIIPGKQYDEIVFVSTIDFYSGGNYIFYWYAFEDTLSPDLLAKRKAYISKLQAS